MLLVIAVIVCLWLYYLDHREAEAPKPPKPPLPPDVQEKQRRKWGLLLIGLVVYGALWYLGVIRVPDPENGDWAALRDIVIPPILFLIYMAISFWLINRKVDRKYQNLRGSRNMPEMEEEMPDLDDLLEVLPPPVSRPREGGNLR